MMESFERMVQDVEDTETGLFMVTRYDKIFVYGFIIYMMPNPFIPLLLVLLGVFLAWGAVSGRTRSKQPEVRR